MRSSRGWRRARHDGGDAKTGFGIELGGGIGWSDPASGLSLDLAGRALVAHADGSLGDQGLSGAVVWDPAPGTERGPSPGVSQSLGGRAAHGNRGVLGDAGPRGPLHRRTPRQLWRLGRRTRLRHRLATDA